jgi:unsaturated chondroitin disaccharide hydrolase
MEKSEREAYEYLVERVGSTLDETGGAFPYFADPETGAWTTTENGNWCGGHWIHMLWRAHQYTGEERFASAAREHAETMVDYMPRRAMFCGMNFHYAGFRAYDLTGAKRDRNLGVDGADAMVEYFHKGARQIPLGVLEIESPSPEFRGPESDEGPSGDHLGAVDAIYTSVPVLWRAYEETGDPVYRDTAISHADRHLDWYIRDDGRTWHHAEFDPETGDLRRQYNELAYSDETCWARGQGWCIAGLARAYEETGADRYLDALETTVGYYVENSPPNLVPHWDFEHPDKPNVPRDTSAAALTAYGLTGLSRTPETAELVETGDRILGSLVREYLTPLESGEDRPAGMVLEGCYNGPSGFADANELVWTDYYLLESLAPRAR